MDFGKDLRFVRVSNSSAKTCASTSKHFFKGYYGVQLIFEGEIYGAVGDNPMEYAKGPVAFISYPGVPFTYGSPEGTFRNIAYICFEGDRVQEYIRTGLLNLREKQLFIPISDSRKLFSTVELLLRNLAVPGNAIHHARAVLLLEELLLQLQESDGTVGPGINPYRSELHELCSKIATEPELDWDFKQESLRMQLSYAHFRRIFARETGLSPKQYLLECRLRQVERMLINTNDRISEIAERCGFEGVFHLFRIFKKHRRLAPSQFRKIYSINHSGK